MLGWSMSSSQCYSAMWGWAAVPKVSLLTQMCGEQYFDQPLEKPKHKDFGKVPSFSGEDWLFLLKSMHTFALFIHTQRCAQWLILLTMLNYPFKQTPTEILTAERCSFFPSCWLIQMKSTHKPHLQLSKLT